MFLPLALTWAAKGEVVARLTREGEAAFRLEIRNETDRELAFTTDPHAYEVIVKNDKGIQIGSLDHYMKGAGFPDGSFYGPYDGLVRSGQDWTMLPRRGRISFGLCLYDYLQSISKLPPSGSATVVYRPEYAPEDILPDWLKSGMVERGVFPKVPTIVWRPRRR